MKKILFLASALLVTSGINAQITLTSSSYPVSVLGTDSLEVTAAASSLPSFAAVTNGSWDLSTITDSALTFAYRVNRDTSSCEFADSNEYAFSTYSYQGNVQAIINSNGLIEYAAFIPGSVINISGGVGTINVPAQHAVFSAPHTVIKFPATINNSWTSNYESDFNFQITVSLAGYSNAPGIVKSFITEKDTVVGWGLMRVKDITGNPSAWFHVLQVQATTSVMDSFLINGTVPSSTALNALGVTEGQVTTSYIENYYRAEEVTPFAKVTFDSGFITPSQAITHTQRLSNTGVTNVINTADIKIYPNPSSGGTISIDVPAAAGAWSYQLENVVGQAVATNVLALSNNQTHTQVQFPATLMTGIYYIRLFNDGRQVAVKPLQIN